jgi:hypothetical protein
MCLELTDPGRPDPDRNSLDADTDPDPANDADPTRSGSTTLLSSQHKVFCMFLSPPRQTSETER